VIDVREVTKRYGEKVAVDELTFQVRPGIVTGFLGPNGAGKSTTMRLILGLDAPTSGQVTVDGRVYRDLPAPLHEVGAMLEAHAIHTGRSAFNHLLALAQTHGIARTRVEEVIELVGLGEVARKRVGSFSLGMGQRLGVASALLGDPATVILDEPANGLDPEGTHWVRTLLKRLASEGRTVFLSSHLMSEMAQTAEHLVVVGRGRLIADTAVADFVRRASSDATVHVRSSQAAELEVALRRPVIGTALYMVVLGVFALSLGALVRNTAGGIAIFAGMLFVLPGLAHVLPASTFNGINPYLPSNAGSDVLSNTTDPGMLAPWTGFAVFCAYAAAAFAAAAVLLVRRDA
jgi:ABC-2 type transport system ATP-binding protein